MTFDRLENRKFGGSALEKEFRKIKMRTQKKGLQLIDAQNLLYNTLDLGSVLSVVASKS